ncbi:hypothetical protein C8R46DRAFT_105378 [Mycena filopes]|nr:hypothetical protein C8R46DRAFT_105378 [Mycena filopes]
MGNSSSSERNSRDSSRNPSRSASPISPDDKRVRRAVYVLDRARTDSSATDAHARIREAVGTVPEGPPSTLHHWGVRVGELVYDLTAEEGKTVYRVVEYKKTEWTGRYKVGETRLTDEEVRNAGSITYDNMPGLADYNFIFNNCHTFVVRFLKQFETGDIDSDRLDKVDNVSAAWTARGVIGVVALVGLHLLDQALDLALEALL